MFPSLEFASQIFDFILLKVILSALSLDSIFSLLFLPRFTHP